jgi:hypothetical protein
MHFKTYEKNMVTRYDITQKRLFVREDKNINRTGTTSPQPPPKEGEQRRHMNNLVQAVGAARRSAGKHVRDKKNLARDEIRYVRDETQRRSFEKNLVRDETCYARDETQKRSFEKNLARDETCYARDKIRYV